jgi:serine/threonine protein kinase
MDIKIENFIWDLARKKVTAIDFGLSREYKINGLGSKTVVQNNLAGTPQFLAPELFGAAPYTYTDKTEVFALGTFFKELLFNYSVEWIASKRRETCLSKTKLEVDKALGVVKLVQAMTDLKPEKRPTMDDIIKELHAIQGRYIDKYPEEYKKRLRIYKKAEKEELERLNSIPERVMTRESSDLDSPSYRYYRF